MAQKDYDELYTNSKRAYNEMKSKCFDKCDDGKYEAKFDKCMKKCEEDAKKWFKTMIEDLNKLPVAWGKGIKTRKPNI